MSGSFCKARAVPGGWWPQVLPWHMHVLPWYMHVLSWGPTVQGTSPLYRPTNSGRLETGTWSLVPYHAFSPQNTFHVRKARGPVTTQEAGVLLAGWSGPLQAKPSKPRGMTAPSRTAQPHLPKHTLQVPLGIPGACLARGAVADTLIGQCTRGHFLKRFYKAPPEVLTHIFFHANATFLCLCSAPRRA